MLDVAWPELMVIGIVAVVAIGPKDLPKVMRTLGKWAGKARALTHEVQRTFHQFNYEAEVAERLKRASAPPVKGPDQPFQPPPKTETPAAPEKEPHDQSGNA